MYGEHSICSCKLLDGLKRFFFYKIRSAQLIRLGIAEVLYKDDNIRCEAEGPSQKIFYTYTASHMRYIYL